jgi:hypothetical protein
MNVYDIFVDGKVVAENVNECDLKHKIEIIRAYCNLLPENRFSRVTYEPINNPETIA